GVIEVPPHVENARAVGHGLSELSLRDVAVWDEDIGIEPAAGGVGRSGGAGVAGGGAEDSFGIGLQRLGDGDDHAAVFEGARGVAHLQLEVELAAAHAPLNSPRADKRRIALAEGNEWSLEANGQAIAIAAEDALMARRFSLRPVAHPGRVLCFPARAPRAAAAADAAAPGTPAW